MRQSTVSVRGQTVIPQEIRKQFGIQPNTKLAWSTLNGVIIVVPIPEDPITASVGLLKNTDFTFQDFLEERQRERELDRRREERLMKQVKRAEKRQRGT